MEWQALGDFIVNNGISIVVVLYFLHKDATLTKENTDILNQVKNMLELLINERRDV